MNGHGVNGAADANPGPNEDFCSKCGEPTIRQCPACNEQIRGHYFDTEDWEEIRAPGFTPRTYCHRCGKAYPWTIRAEAAVAATIDELEELTTAERDALKSSIPDLLVETLKTQPALLRLKKAMGKVGAAGAKFLTDVLTKVAAEVVVKAMKLP